MVCAMVKLYINIKNTIDCVHSCRTLHNRHILNIVWPSREVWLVKVIH